MAAVNINRGVDDPFYRYKMPKLQSKIEGKGNGIKTVLPNIEEIARSLSRPPSYPHKFFGCELGAQTQIKNDDKTNILRFIVNGAHETKRLEELLDLFIKKFVLCQACGNPETDMVFNKKNEIHLDCKACGARKMIDMRHKLTTFMLNNPPTPVGGKDGAPKKKSKEERRQEKNARNAAKKDEEGDESNAATPQAGRSSNASPIDEDEDDSGMQFTPGAGLDESTLNGASQISLADNGADDDDAFSADTLAVAEAARKKQLSEMNDNIKNLLVGDAKEAKEAPLKDSYDEFAEFLEGNHTAAEINAEMTRLRLDDQKAAAVLTQVLLDGPAVLETLKKKATIFQKVVRSPQMQKGVVGGVERLLGTTHPEQLGHVSQVLMFLYDKDIVEEEVFLKWAENPSKKYGNKEAAANVRAKAAPFLEWLRNAEEESD